MAEFKRVIQRTTNSERVETGVADLQPNEICIVEDVEEVIYKNKDGKYISVSKDKYTVETIEELKSSKKYKVGDVVQVLGYYTPGDGAHHPRQKVDDTYLGEDAIDCVDGNKWKIVHSGCVDISWFGAKGNGYDDTEFFEKASNFTNIRLNKNYNLTKLFKKNFILKDGKAFTNRKQSLQNIGDWKNISIDFELDLYFSTYEELKSQGYNLYPSSFTFIDEMGYILIQYHTLAGDQTKTWHKVCDFKNNYEEVCVFSLEGVVGSEGIHTYVDNNFIYIAIKGGIYKLPLDLPSAHLKNYNKIVDLPITHQTMTAGYKDNLFLEVSENSFGRTRENYSIYSMKGTIDGTDKNITGSVKFDLSSTKFGKIQGIGISEDRIYISGGGYFTHSNNDYKPEYDNYTIRECSATGDVINKLELNPIKLKPILESHIKDYRGITICENEGVSCSYYTGKKRIFSLMVISDYKMLILEHNTDNKNSIDVSNAISNSGFVDIKNRQGVCNSETPLNIKTGKTMKTLEEIADYMLENFINHYSFYNNSSVNIIGLKGDIIPLNTYIVIKSFNYYTFFIEIYNNTNYRKGAFSGAKGDRNIYYQTLKIETNVNDSIKNNVIISPSESRINYYLDSSQSKISSSFYYGDTSVTKVNVGSISHTTTETRYATTSDPRLKTDFKSHETVWEDFKKINDCVGKYSFKHDLSKEILGFNAHKLIDYGFSAAAEGEGGRELQIGDVYAHTYNDEGEIIEHIVTPASVDASLLVPYLVTAIHNCKKELDELKNKLIKGGANE